MITEKDIQTYIDNIRLGKIEAKVTETEIVLKDNTTLSFGIRAKYLPNSGEILATVKSAEQYDKVAEALRNGEEYVAHIWNSAYYFPIEISHELYKSATQLIKELSERNKLKVEKEISDLLNA